MCVCVCKEGGGVGWGALDEDWRVRWEQRGGGVENVYMDVMSAGDSC